MLETTNTQEGCAVKSYYIDEHEDIVLNELSQSHKATVVGLCVNETCKCIKFTEAKYKGTCPGV